MKILKPSFFSTFISVLIGMFILMIFVIIALWFVYGNIFKHLNFTNEIQISLFPLILSIFASIIIWFVLVPSQLAYSEKNFKIKMHFFGIHTFAWDELKYYFPSPNFKIEFENHQVFQIFRDGYPKIDWAEFMNFLERTFPKYKASRSIGARIFSFRGIGENDLHP